MSRSYILFVWLAFTVLFLDQLSKTLIFHLLFLGQSLPVLGDFFRITYILNPGGAFGTQIGGSSFYLIVSLIAIMFTIVFFVKTHPQKLLVKIGLALVLGGALGNLTDRFRFGQVIDFLDFDFPDIHIPSLDWGIFGWAGFSLERWPIFNLADTAITVGALLIVFHIVRHREKRVIKVESQGLHPED